MSKLEVADAILDRVLGLRAGRARPQATSDRDDRRARRARSRSAARALRGSPALPPARSGIRDLPLTARPARRRRPPPSERVEAARARVHAVQALPEPDHDRLRRGQSGGAAHGRRRGARRGGGPSRGSPSSAAPASSSRRCSTSVGFDRERGLHLQRREVPAGAEPQSRARRGRGVQSVPDGPDRHHPARRDLRPRQLRRADPLADAGGDHPAARPDLSARRRRRACRPSIRRSSCATPAPRSGAWPGTTSSSSGGSTTGSGAGAAGA